MIVVDASVLAPALAATTRRRPCPRTPERRASGSAGAGRPGGCLELAPRGTGRRLDERRSAQTLTDLTALPLRHVPHLPLLARVWELRDNLSASDASYVALAEALDTVLLTADGRIKRASGVNCEIVVLA